MEDILLGDYPGGVFVLDVKHEQGAVLTRGKQDSVIMGEHELGDGAAAAAELLELPIQGVLVRPDAACVCASEQHPAACAAEAGRQSGAAEEDEE